MVSPVVVYGCESWTIKKAECGRIDAFELWYWKRLLRVPWNAKRSNQSILKEINPKYSLGLMLKLKLQYFGHLMGRADSFEKILILWKVEGRRSRGQKMRWLDGIINSMEMRWEMAMDRETWNAAVRGIAKRTTGLSSWTTKLHLLLGFPGGPDSKVSAWLQMPFCRKWQPTPVLLPGKSLGRRSLVSYSPWDHTVGHNWAISLLSLRLCHFTREEETSSKRI